MIVRTWVPWDGGDGLMGTAARLLRLFALAPPTGCWRARGLVDRTVIRHPRSVKPQALTELWKKPSVWSETRNWIELMYESTVA